MKNIKILFLLFISCSQLKSADDISDFTLNLGQSLRASEVLKKLANSPRISELPTKPVVYRSDELLQEIQDILISKKNIDTTIDALQSKLNTINDTYNKETDNNEKLMLEKQIGKLRSEMTETNKKQKEITDNFKNKIEEYISEFGVFDDQARGTGNIQSINALLGRVDRKITAKGRNEPIENDVKLNQLLDLALENFKEKLDELKISLGDKKYQASLDELKNYILHASYFEKDESDK